MYMTHEKKEEADMVVESLTELYPENQDVQTFEAQPAETPESKGGNLGVRLVDGNDNSKHETQYLRVPDQGSVEAFKLDDGSWAVKRRDKLPHNKGL